MTTATAPVTGALTAPHRLRWLLRLHRPALYVWTAAVVVLTAALLWLGGPLTDAAVHAWRQYDVCRTGATCVYDQDAILRYKDVYQYTTWAVLALPFLVAAWAGAALTGREVESGTAHLAWTQGVSPARWLAAKLAAPAAVAAAGTAVLVALHRWAWLADHGGIDTAKSWSSFETYYANGPLPVALALAGLAAGALAGLATGRALAALAWGMSATLVLWGAVHLAAPRLYPAVTRTAGLDHEGPVGSGIVLDSGIVTADGRHLPDPFCGSSAYSTCQALYERIDAVGFFNVYHPRSHYWPLQLLATAPVLAAAALLALAAFVLLRRRTQGKAATA
ncbi:ABC transporter permease [Streptomyces sp. NPDC096080]|uniref:ABC transporter permease n=1 Tax=Streptomyces sp. NPDC096080 TaxID=3156693 RepID=UPI00332E7634